MSVFIFIVILAILIFVHELGHFIAAKRSGIKVTEFGFGFPPKVWGRMKGETLYSLNAIPFGGFVRIFGEDPNDESLNGPEKNRSITAKSKWIQAWVLVAGVFFNIVFAWMLIAGGYMIGLPTSVSHGGSGIVENASLTIIAVSPNTPAEKAGLRVGDTVVGVTSEGKFSLDEIHPDTVSNFIEAHGRKGVQFAINRKGGSEEITVVAEEGVIPNKVAIGIQMDEIGTLTLPPHLALLEASRDTVRLFVGTAVGLVSFLGSALIGAGDFSQVTGPVGIAGMVGEVSKLGFVYLMSFTALISVNLAVINLFPFPALDGGRLLLLFIESIIRKPIPARVSNTINGVGFLLLLILMAVVTFNDILKLFS